MDERESEQDLITEVLGTDVSDKKKTGKFQPFRKLFGKRKKKGASQALEDGKLNPSQSTENVCNGAFSSDEETNDDLRIPNSNMGTRAFSHDSIFIPDGPAEDKQTVQTMSQDNILGKVKTLQQQLVKNIKFGHPPASVSGRRMQDTEENNIDGGSPTDPMEALSQLDSALSDNDYKSSDSPDAVSPVSLPGAGPEEEAKVTPVKSSRSKRPITGSSTIQSINLDAVPRAVARLDNSAAKHKLSVKPKNQRRSKKHKLDKDQQNVIVAADEQEVRAIHQYKEQYPIKNVHTARDKHTVHVEIHTQSQLAESRLLQAEHQRCLEEEKKRLKEEERRCEEERLQLIEEEKQNQLEEQLLKEEERRQEELKHQELEASRKQEEQRQRELEEQRRLEMAAQQHLEEERKRQEEEMKKQLEERRKLEEQRQHELEEQKRLEMVAQQRLEEERKRQEEQKQKELEERRRLEEQRQHELEEQKRQEEERKRQKEQQQRQLEERRRQEEQRQRELEGKKRQEEERKRQEEQKQRQLEERKRQEEQRERELEEQKHQEVERKRKEQKELEERGRLEEQRQREIEEKKRQEEEKKRQEEQKQRQLEERKRQEEQRQRELEEKRLELEEKQRQEDERRRQEKQKQKELEEHRRQEEQRQRELEEVKRLETEERQRQEQEKRRQEEQRRQQMEQKQREIEEQEQMIKQQQAEDAKRQEKEGMDFGNVERLPSEKECQLLHEEKQHTSKQAAPEQATERQRRQVKAREQQRIGEELKWQEVDERQTMPRPYTFQVSSGEKQIIFPKVHLSPVTPSKEPTHSSDMKEPKNQEPSKGGSHAFPSSMGVPHTAILVTGAQLCGTAVNLNQIKDTACKSLLGLTEGGKATDYPLPDHTPKIREHDNKPSNSKTKFTSDSLDNQAMLAEWASIRSRILKSSENGKTTEKDQRILSRCSDDWTDKGKGDSHGNLRKTMSASAKFSITPAWQKFAETAKSSTNEEHPSPVKQAGKVKAVDDVAQFESLTKYEDDATSPAGVESIHERGAGVKEKHGKKADSAEGCKFAKDLPSFLVPSPPQSPSKGLSQPDTPAASEGQLTSSTRKPEKAGPNGEEKTSPFGIKLRRTNYSLRFHCDHHGEQKRKKRYSAGDSFEGVPTPLMKTESDSETHNVSLKQMSSPNVENREAMASVSKGSSNNASDTAVPPLLPPINSHASSIGNDKEVPKSLIPPKPSLSPKPTSPTPPSSPLMKTVRSHSLTKVETEATGRKEAGNVGVVLPLLQNDKSEEEETKEKKSFFPSINIPWREKGDKKPELSRRDKPVLQSRHSIDGSKLPDKVEAAQPLWITLALQKQKGFREQQATREERKQAREAKQAEKLAKENVGVSNQNESKSSNICRASTLQKSAFQDDEKKIETSVSRLERREQLKKSNTLPTSVTVEISDSIPSAPLVKDISKRFSTPDATPMSTEPAWLALAKRKAKAWSDCPQIIK